MAWTRRIVSLVVVAALVAGGGYLVQRSLLAGQRPPAPIYATARAFVGTMTADVVGFGPLQPVYLSTLQTAAGGTVTKVLVQAGQHVSKGATIALLSNPSLAAKIAQDQAKLSGDERILATTLGVPVQKALAAAASAGGVTATAPQSGRVVSVQVATGDSVTQGQPLVQIVDDSEVQVGLDLFPYDRARVAVGDPVQVHFNDFSGQVDGVVSQVAANPTPMGIGQAGLGSTGSTGGTGGASGTTGAAGAGVVGPAAASNALTPYLSYPAVLILRNPGLLAPGMTGSAEVKTPAGWVGLTEPATVTGYKAQETVESPLAGTVVGVDVQPEQWVQKGQPLVAVGGAAAGTSIATLAANVQEDEATLQADQQEEQGLKVRSDINGEIAWLNARPGMRVGPNQPLGSIFDSSRMTLTIQVDELQVANVRQGQQVIVTSPGLPGRTFHGTVASVGAIGQNNGGLATFAVQIDISGTSALKPGMTADARIVIRTVPGALMVPVEAVVQSGSRAEVEVLDGGKPTFAPVRVGLVNDRYAQITSGLRQGEVVVTGAAGGFAPATSAGGGGSRGSTAQPGRPATKAPRVQVAPAKPATVSPAGARGGGK